MPSTDAIHGQTADTGIERTAATDSARSQIADAGTAQAAAHGAEQRVLRAGCGLVDRSDRGKLALTGSGAAEFLNGQVTNDVEQLAAGEGCYAAFLTPKGKMLGDLRILRTHSELLLDTERVSLQALFDMIRRFKIGYEVELHKRTLESALLCLIGPRARDLAAAALGARSPSGPGDEVERAEGADALPPLAAHAHRGSAIVGRPVRLISTANPDGLDVLCDAKDREAVQAALIAAGAQQVSEAAAEVLRVEHGIPRYGIDLDESVIPQEAGLNEIAVSFTKGCYVGQETVARLHYRGRPNRHLRGLLLQEPQSSGAKIDRGGRVVGRLGSSVVSPTFGPIALALVRREVEPGEAVSVGERDVQARIVELPFEAARDAAAR